MLFSSVVNLYLVYMAQSAKKESRATPMMRRIGNPIRAGRWYYYLILPENEEEGSA